MNRKGYVFVSDVSEAFWMERKGEWGKMMKSSQLSASRSNVLSFRLLYQVSLFPVFSFRPSFVHF